LSLYYKMFSCDERKRGLCQNYILSQNAKNERKGKNKKNIPRLKILTNKKHSFDIFQIF
jgi:hypothetical protein